MKRTCEVCELDRAIRRMEIEKPTGRTFWLDVCLRCGLALAVPEYLP